MAGTILVVDDDPALRRLVEFELSEQGYEIRTASHAGAAIEALAADEFDVVLLDLNLPDISGFELLEQFGARYPDLPIVVLTAHGEVDDVVRCMRLGAADFVQKPFDRARLLMSVRNALVRGTLESKVTTLTEELRSGEGFDRILGESPALARAVELLKRAARSDVTVLLTGASGTGKEVAARALHAGSSRRSAPFVAVNCGAIPENLIESELFGHEKGAFTGATERRIGRFEQADGGTLFLDEIGELRADLQVRLLRVLQERVVQRLGATQPKSVDVRVVAATNRDLKADSRDGTFREDLYYRLAVFPVELPPLAEREGDVLLLASAFLQRFVARHGRRISGFTADATAALTAYGWPGNVRELENVIERAVILEDGKRISLGSLSDDIVASLDPALLDRPRGDDDEADAATDAPAMDLGRLPDEIVPLHVQERRLIVHALERTDWNVVQAAKQLEIGRATIYRKIERYGLSRGSRDS